MQLTFASYNIHKAVGLDRKRDPERILSVLNEIDADIIALQEADRRIGERASVLPRAEIDDTRWRVIEVAKRPRSIGWHGNALLVRRDLEVVSGEALDLPTLEPRGAACGEIMIEGERLRVIGTHLDLSGLRRRDQIRSLLTFVDECAGDLPTVIMGDFNQWGRSTGAMREFTNGWRIPRSQLPQPPAGGHARPHRGEQALEPRRRRGPPHRPFGGGFGSFAHHGHARPDQKIGMRLICGQ